MRLVGRVVATVSYNWMLKEILQGQAGEKQMCVFSFTECLRSLLAARVIGVTITNLQLN